LPTAHVAKVMAHGAGVLTVINFFPPHVRVDMAGWRGADGVGKNIK